MSRYYDNIDVRNTLKATNTENVELIGNRMNIGNLATGDLKSDDLDVTNIYSNNISATNSTLTNFSFTNITIQNISSTDVKITNLNTLNLTATNITSTFVNSQLTTLIGNGTEALPSISYNGDNDTGINRISEDTIGFSADGTNRFIVSNNSITLKVPFVPTSNVVSAATPHISFENDVDTGYYITTGIRNGFSTNGTLRTFIDQNLINEPTSRIFTGNGTVADPPYTFITDQNTGIFHGINEDEVGITTNDTQRLLLGNLSATASNPLFQEVTNVSASVITNISASTGFLAYDKESQPIVSQETAKSLILNTQSATFISVDGNWNDISYSPTFNRWVAVGSSTSTINIIYSNDGENWISGGVGLTLGSDDELFSITWSSLYNRFVTSVSDSLGGTCSSGGTLRQSNDGGLSWSSFNGGVITDNGFPIPSVKWINERSLYIAPGRYFPNNFVGSNPPTIGVNITSGSSWTTALSVSTGIFQIAGTDSIYISDFDIFVCVGHNPFILGSYTTSLVYSRNFPVWDVPIGYTYSPNLSSAPFLPFSIAYSKKLKLAVVVGNPVTSNYSYITSRDGVNWSNGNTSLPNTLFWRKVIWIDDLGVFLATSQPKSAGQTSQCAYSFDGYNWTTFIPINLTNLTYTSAFYSPEQGRLAITVRGTGLSANQKILMTKPSSLFATPQSAFNLPLTIGISFGRFQYTKGLSTNMGNIMDFYNPYSSDNIFPRYNFDTTTLSGLPSTLAKYWGACLARNGKIYAIGVDVTNILVIDPFKNTTKTIPYTPGSSASPNSYYLGLVQAPNGLLYAIPSNADNILTLDPITEVVNPNAISTGATAGFKYRGGVLAPNGNIYCIPNSGNVGVINTSANTFSTIGTGLSNYNGGVLGTNGNIYCAPAQTGITSVLVINTSDNTTSTITIASQVNNSHAGGAIAPNGNIYFAPRGSGSILKIAPPYTAATFIAISESNLNNYIGAVCGLDGNIYFSPCDSTNVLILNPNNDNFDKTSISGLSSSLNKYRTIISSLDGRLFCIPTDATNIGIIKIGTPTQPPWMLGACFNKY